LLLTFPRIVHIIVYAQYEIRAERQSKAGEAFQAFEVPSPVHIK